MLKSTKRSLLQEITEKELKLINGGTEELPPSPSPNSPLTVVDGKVPGTITAVAHLPVTETIAIHPYVNASPDGTINGGGFQITYNLPM